MALNCPKDISEEEKFRGAGDRGVSREEVPIFHEDLSKSIDEKWGTKNRLGSTRRKGEICASVEAGVESFLWPRRYGQANGSQKEKQRVPKKGGERRLERNNLFAMHKFSGCENNNKKPQNKQTTKKKNLKTGTADGKPPKMEEGKGGKKCRFRGRNARVGQ